MRRLLYAATLSMIAMLILAPAALGQDVDCPQLAPGEAEAILAADPSDPNRLDADNDGIPCEGNDTGATTQPDIQYTPDMTTDMQYTQYTTTPTTTAPTATAPTATAPTATTTPTATTAPTATTTTTTTALPATGGISLLIPAGVLLASGLIGLGVMRRNK